MWILKTDDSKASRYQKMVYRLTTLGFHEKTKLKKNVRGRKNGCAAHKYFTIDRFNDYLTARPEKLMEYHDEMLRDIGNANRELEEVDKAFVKHLFNYDSYIKGNKEMSYALAHLLDANTCTYCNRQYTLTVEDKGMAGDKKYLIRPEFDHWFLQKDYPELALSFFNLIPACHICNSNLKRDKETELEKHIHPYIDSKAGFNFSYIPTSDGYAVDIEREGGVEDDYFERVENTLDLFKIRQIYGAHSGLELKEMLSLAAANHPDYISTLVNEVMVKLGVREEDAYRILFGIETSEDNYLKRPMSKFMSDIIRKIKEDFG